MQNSNCKNNHGIPSIFTWDDLLRDDCEHISLFIASIFFKLTFIDLLIKMLGEKTFLNTPSCAK